MSLRYFLIIFTILNFLLFTILFNVLNPSLQSSETKVNELQRIDNEDDDDDSIFFGKLDIVTNDKNNIHNEDNNGNPGKDDIKFSKSNRHEEAKKLHEMNNEQIALLKSKKIKLSSSKLLELNSDNILHKLNPFSLLNAYNTTLTNIQFNNKPNDKPKYNINNYGLINEDSYCDIIDQYNLYHSSRLYQNLSYFTDYSLTSIIRQNILSKYGDDTMKQISEDMSPKKKNKALYTLNPNIILFYTKFSIFHYYHEINKNFLCATQLYNHIPGSAAMKRKDLLATNINEYEKKYSKLKKCFQSSDFFPKVYRLWEKEECNVFIKEIDSQEYLEKQQKTPIQFLIKNGYDSQNADGLYLLDQNQHNKLKKIYGDKGEQCGLIAKSIIAQEYIHNPLLLDKQNKFDLRVFLLIASTNPLIAYYHDGFIIPSLAVYDPNSAQKEAHLVLNSINQQIFPAALNATFKGMTDMDLKEYQTMPMDNLTNFLNEKGSIQNKKSFNEKLQKKIQKALIHLIRMNLDNLFKHSGVFELYAIDIIINQDYDPYIIDIESNITMNIYNNNVNNSYTKMIEDMLDIQISLYRSRIQRIFKTIQKIYKDRDMENQLKNSFEELTKEYQKSNKNHMSTKYKPSKDNSWINIIDMNLKGKKAYHGLLAQKCI